MVVIDVAVEALVTRNSRSDCIARYNIALIINFGDGGEVCLVPKDSVKSIGLSTCLRGLSVSGEFCVSASIFRSLISVT